MAENEAPDFLTVPQSNGAGNSDDSQPQVGMLAQYIKDFSFENPNAPAVYNWQNAAADRRAVQHRHPVDRR